APAPPRLTAPERSRRFAEAPCVGTAHRGKRRRLDGRAWAAPAVAGGAARKSWVDDRSRAGHPQAGVGGLRVLEQAFAANHDADRRHAPSHRGSPRSTQWIVCSLPGFRDEALVRDPRPQHAPVVLGFGRLGDLLAVRSEDASAAAAADLALVLA